VKIEVGMVVARSSASRVFLVAVMATSACTSFAIADTPDAGSASEARPKKEPVAKKKAEPRGLAGIGGGRGLGPGAYPECIPATDAQKKATPPSRGSDSGPPQPIIQSPDIPECPLRIWTWVGAGHGAHPIGNVTAPLGLPETRKQRRQDPHACCYMIPAAPGSPAG
jgi:hypothetical protein